MYSTIVSGAFAEPRTSPFCGMPANSRCTAAAFGEAFVGEPTVGIVAAEDELLPPTASAIPTTAPTITSPARKAMTRTFGDARRRAPLRATGAGAATCCLRRRACLPLIHNQR